MKLVSEYIKDIRCEFKGYNSKKFIKDLMAGITVAAVALPLAIAFGVGSGASAAAGLVTAIIGGIVIGIFSGASFQISGPTGAMAAVLITLAARYGLDGIFISCLIAGIILVIAGIFKLGRVIYFIPSSVITGFTSGIAVIIALGQLDNLFGVTSHGELAVQKLLSYFVDGFEPNFYSVAVGLAVIIFMFLYPKKLNEKFPASLAALVLVLIINSFAKLPIALVGDIPRTLILDERLSIGSILSVNLGEFFLPAMSIAALAMIESLLCGTAAGKMKNEKMNGDRELVAQGIGNIVIPFFGGVPATAAIARTSVVIKAGCETRLATIIHSIILLLSMFVLAPVMSTVPLSALAGVLIVTSWRMNDWDNIHFIFRKKFKSDIASFLITLVATALLDLTQAVIIGVLFATFLIVVRLTEIEVNISEVDRKKLEEIGIVIPKISKKIRVAYLTGTIFFAVVEKLLSQLRELEDTKVLIISMRGVPVIDLSGVQGLIELIGNLHKQEVKGMFTSVQPKVIESMKRGGIIELVGAENVFSSAEFAIIEAHKAL